MKRRTRAVLSICFLCTPCLLSAADPAGPKKQAPSSSGAAASEAPKVEADHPASPSLDETAGRKLLAQALAAKGGRAAVSKVKNLSRAGKGTLAMENKITSLTFARFVLPGRASREEMTFGSTVVVNVVSPDVAYMKQGDQVEDMSAQVATAMRASLWRDPDFLLLNASDPKTHVRQLPSDTDHGTKLDELEITAPGGDKITVGLDAKTHLIARLEYVENFKKLVDKFEDYHAKNGVTFAHKETRTGEDGEQLVLTFDKVELNRALAPGLFAKP